MRPPNNASSSSIMRLSQRTLWAMWWIGSVPIVLSYVRLVPVWLAWCGFALAGASTLIGVIQNRAWRPPPPTGGGGPSDTTP